MKNTKKLSQEHIDNAWLGLGDTSKIQDLPNPLKRPEWIKKDPGLWEVALLLNPRYLGSTAKLLLGIDLLPEQIVILQELWTRSFPMFIASRGFGKSWLLAVYCLLKCILTPSAKAGGAGAKIVVAGAAFRQSKVIFEYMETLWHNAPLLRDLCDQNSGPRRDVDRCTMRINENWAIAIPIGTGEKIRGLRANIVIADEFASISPDIYETVLQGFAVVSANPLDNVQRHARRELKKEHGIWSEDEEFVFKSSTGNQIIISGTAYFDFNHMADYWKKYCRYVKGIVDFGIIEDMYECEEDGIPESFNPNSYSVIRIPYELVPKGFMDDNVVTRAKATIHSGTYASEYGAVFTTDSNGFFRRRLIEHTVASTQNVGSPGWPIWCPNVFDAKTRGDKMLGYVYGIDPASEQDNFSIVVLEIHPTHRRVVYCWVTSRKNFLARQRAGLTKDSDFYGFCARKIRELMKVFPLAEGHPMGSSIGMDAQGGGIAVMEALHDKDKLEQGEITIWPIINPDKEQPTDIESGLHVLELVQFANFEWTSTANHGMRKDFEDRALLFPRFDPISIEMAVAQDKVRADKFKEKYDKELIIYDSLEDCVMEIEELKSELTSIVVTRTGTGVAGRDRWDTPEIKERDGKKGRLRKDRYSALLIANMIGRQIQRASAPIDYDVIGGFTRDIAIDDNNGPMYNGPDWFTKGMAEIGSLIGR